LEILNFIPQTIDLIKELKKKSLKQNLTFSEDYLLYCLGERCYSKMNDINHDRGNLDLDEVRRFDLKILELKETIKFSVESFSSLWKTICSESNFLYMFRIQPEKLGRYLQSGIVSNVQD
jgi:hypothetical protein